MHSSWYDSDSPDSFKNISYPIRSILGISFFQSLEAYKILRSYDVVISEGNIRYLDRNLWVLFPRNFKWIFWGIGVSASYRKKYDENKRYDWIRYFLFRKADANIFYSEYPVKKYIDKGFNKERLYVARNSVKVAYDEHQSYTKNSYLFVGTLYKEKGIFDLLRSYAQYVEVVSSPLILKVVGDGPEMDAIKDWLKSSGIENFVQLHGAVYDVDALEVFFRQALVCISPRQAGLSVVSSMGHGTPFVTRVDAITGGEIFNIKHGDNGIIYSSNDELIDVLLDVHWDRDKFILMGKSARKHYSDSCSPEQMVETLFRACKDVYMDE
jgi:glycosyltransferase involved in cell wall biosynthesis